MPIITVQQKIMQAYEEGKAFGIVEERKRVRLAVESVQEMQNVDINTIYATGWNNCRAEFLKKIGVQAWSI